MIKKIVIIIILLTVIRCTVIKNHGVLNYTPNTDTKLIDWHPNRHPGYSILSKEKEGKVDVADTLK